MDLAEGTTTTVRIRLWTSHGETSGIRARIVAVVLRPADRYTSFGRPAGGVGAGRERGPSPDSGLAGRGLRATEVGQLQSDSASSRGGPSAPACDLGDR